MLHGEPPLSVPKLVGHLSGGKAGHRLLSTDPLRRAHWHRVLCSDIHGARDEERYSSRPIALDLGVTTAP